MAKQVVIRVRGTSEHSWSAAARDAAKKAYNRASKLGGRAVSLKAVDHTAKISPNPGGIQIFQTNVDVTVQIP